MSKRSSNNNNSIVEQESSVATKTNIRSFYGSRNVPVFRWQKTEKKQVISDHEKSIINVNKTNTRFTTEDRKSTPVKNRKTFENPHISSTLPFTRRTPTRKCKLKGGKNQTDEMDTKRRKLKDLSDQIDHMEPLRKNDNTLQVCSIKTKTSFCSNQNTKTKSLSPVTINKDPNINEDKRYKNDKELSNDQRKTPSKSPSKNKNASLRISDVQDTPRSAIKCSSRRNLEGEDNIETIDISGTNQMNDQEEEEEYEMFNCDFNSHDSSFKSDLSNSSSMSSPRKTPKRKNKTTILNYFTRMNNERMKIVGANTNDKDDENTKSIKINGREKKRQFKSPERKNGTQLHFSRTGLSPVAVIEENLLFDLPTSSTSNVTKTSKRKSMKNKLNGSANMEQMYIDIGQKDFGHVKCETCGMVYTKCQEEDEAQHAKYHQKIVQKLKFKGWKNERVLEEFHDGRIVSILPNDHVMHLKKLTEIREVVDSELGFVTGSTAELQGDEQAFLFISSKKIIGCAIVVSISKAYPVLLDDTSTKEEKDTQSWCCSSDPVKAVCGVSRIWVFSQSRRQKIASRLVDCVRRNFLYGCIVEKKMLAFSDPTPNGRIFAETYIGKKDILVFR